jgi:biopolymer transport protein ExbB
MAALGTPWAAAAEPTNPAPGTEVGQKSLLDLYTTGGSLMHFILLCSIGTIAGVVYCFIFVNRRKMLPPAIHHSLVQLARSRDVNGAWQLCDTSPSAYAHVISPAIRPTNPEWNRRPAKRSTAKNPNKCCGSIT